MSKAGQLLIQSIRLCGYATERLFMKSINMLTTKEIKELSDSVGGVYELSVLSGVRPSTLYRLLTGDFKPSYDSLVKLDTVTKELEALDENLANA